ncbi:MAG: hypothetical protein DNFNHJIP_00029 [Candidatus Argoarchaeum ethanivorans]|uniref:Uncharacterized protein n=1 Tax=Candidatus Argoarchaeum ethanivorans TaxID=2608793 RepID=A0A811ZZE3_9EURY|nr:MAG: hypothetical protein DNFNHJIP_00016 [Candidatus Argoarchaeum ethanivorans]CAD7766631.1 MAG: hypothetical protein DNFNHJIP_00029 [Candidatus Argoarchaeum ethanivorans]
MLCSDDVGLPQVLIVILTIPPPVFRCQMINIIKVVLIKYPFHLSIAPHIAADIVITFGIIEVA